ncbi:hypothetical protein AB2M62_03380 [Sphingomonas sp. MMS12-HWE2-04]|uniref:hypothetical protein n=1 Tax=Sphingomonas sp. MMS12-HWE2-04 TaxID=3234199 RepID=UPI00384F9D96
MAALATLCASPANAQSVEDRARAAAQAARARSSSSEALRGNYVTPGVAGETISTVDGQHSFQPRLMCQKSATLLEVLIQPAGTGDLALVQVSRDTDLDGTVDSRSTLPVPVAGICANGIVSCTPGSWTDCRYFRWEAAPGAAIKLGEVAMPELAGCYCINNSCGTNLAWSNLASVLGDLGGGIVGALTTADPRIGIAQASIDGPVIRYVGAQATACTADPRLGETVYRGNPAALAGDAFAASTSNRVFQALAGSPAVSGKAQQVRRCTIERQVTTQSVEADDILMRVTGGYSELRGGNAVDWLLGSPSNDSLKGGNCRLFDYRLVLRVGDADRIASARLTHIFFDDWAQVRIDGKLILSDPASWTSSGLPASKCERDRTWHNYPDLDLKPYLIPGDHEIWLRVAVGNEGEAFAQIHAELDTSCRSSERLVDLCAATATDPACQVENEFVDGVQTFRSGVRTGLRPLPQTRILGTEICPVQLTRDFFLKERSYRCQIDTGAMPQPDTSRGAYILDHSTETLLADRTRASDGTTTETTRPFVLPDRGSVPACEPICKTRAVRTENAAAPQGVIASQQNAPGGGYDSFYHSCTAGNVCPLGPGEELVSPCGCLDDFPEAVVMMQTVRLAGADLICTEAPK